MTKEEIKKTIETMMMDNYEKGYSDGVQTIIQVLTMEVLNIKTYVKSEELIKNNFLSLLNKFKGKPVKFERK